MYTYKHDIVHYQNRIIKSVKLNFDLQIQIMNILIHIVVIKGISTSRRGIYDLAIAHVHNFTIIEIVKQNCAYTAFSQLAEAVVKYTLEWHQMWFNLQLKTVPNKFTI